MVRGGIDSWGDAAPGLGQDRTQEHLCELIHIAGGPSRRRQICNRGSSTTVDRDEGTGNRSRDIQGRTRFNVQGIIDGHARSVQGHRSSANWLAIDNTLVVDLS